MKLKPEDIQKPLRKLRKQLRKFPSSPAPEDVHMLRTQARRLEATVTALAVGREKESRRLLKLMKPVRKSAGKVRDMDVMISNAVKLSGDRMGEPVVRLVEHMAQKRMRHARKLHDVMRKRREEIRTGLRHLARRMRKKLKDSSGDADGVGAPQILMTELRHWPALDEGNLHLFRIRVKELRYILQLGEGAGAGLVNTLGEVKDSIGEWHDWVELQTIAAKVLDPGAERELLAQIARTAEGALNRAMGAAHGLRARYFGVPEGRKASRKVLPMAS